MCCTCISFSYQNASNTGIYKSSTGFNKNKQKSIDCKLLNLLICIPTIKSFVKSRMFNLINIQLLNILGSEITAKKCMHNDLILNWIPVYIKVTKIDSVRFDHTGIKSFFFKFQISVIFYNFIFFPPFLYFFFFFVSLNFL